MIPVSNLCLLFTYHLYTSSNFLCVLIVIYGVLILRLFWIAAISCLLNHLKTLHQIAHLLALLWIHKDIFHDAVENIDLLLPEAGALG